MHDGTYTNTLLRAFSAETIQRLALREVRFELGHEIEFPGKLIEHLYFVEEGMASQTVTFKDGAQVEVGMFGYESAIGVSALMGTRRSLNRVYTQIAGRGFSTTLENARREFTRCGEFQVLTLRYVQAQLVQVMQSAACNAKHEVEARLARWLLICQDRAHTSTFAMPHEFLSDMLGCTRPTVSVAARILKDRGLISYSRGIIHIQDPGRLQQASCECYAVIKEHLDSYADTEHSSAVS